MQKIDPIQQMALSKKHETAKITSADPVSKTSNQNRRKENLSGAGSHDSFAVLRVDPLTSEAAKTEQLRPKRERQREEEKSPLQRFRADSAEESKLSGAIRSLSNAPERGSIVLLSK